MRRALTRAAPALLAALALSLSCGPATGGGGETTPILPGDDPLGVETPAKKPPAKKPPAKKEKDPWAGRTDLIKPPEPRPVTQVELPKIERFELPNGLKVLVVARRDLPVTSFHLAVGAGSSQEERDTRGLADFAAAMLTRGTKKKNADQISQAIDFAGGSLAAGADFEATHVTCDVMARHATTCLDLVADVATQPAFAAKEVDEVRKQLVNAVRARRDDPRALGEAHFENLLWGEEHVRGWPVTAESVGAIGPKELAAWHAAYFKPENAVLAISGDVDVAELRGRAAKAFAGWKKGAPPKPKRYAAPAWKGVRMRVVDTPEQPLAHILVGHLGVAHGDADYLATVVMNDSLGGGRYASRLAEVTKALGGKGYGAQSGYDRYASRGAFMAATAARTGDTVAVLKLVLGELDKMRKSGPTEAELAAAKAHVAGAYPLAFQTAADVGKAVLSAELHGLGEGYVREFPARVAKLTLGEVKEAAAAHLDDDLVVVIVGDVKAIGPALKKAGYEFEVVGFTEPVSKRDRDAKAAARTKVDPEKAKKGMALVDAAIQARGGEKKLRGLKEVVARGKLIIDTKGGPVVGEYVRYYSAAGKLRVDVTVPQKGTLRFVLTPTSSFLELGGQVQEVPEEDLEVLKMLLYADGDAVLLHAKAAGATVQLDEPQEVDGKPYDAVRVVAPDKKSEVLLILDPKTHLPYGVCYPVQGETLCDEYADYKTVSGLQMPFAYRTINLFIGGLPIEVQFEKIEVNAGLPAKVFDKP